MQLCIFDIPLWILLLQLNSTIYNILYILFFSRTLLYKILFSILFIFLYIVFIVSFQCPSIESRAWQANRECNYRLYRPIATVSAAAAAATVAVAVVAFAVMLQPKYKIKNKKEKKMRTTTTKNYTYLYLIWHCARISTWTIIIINAMTSQITILFEMHFGKWVRSART